ncbi:MAG: hypothetical protein H6849_02535 [Alphaproteobacteria bacterium]|nr:MAG: hypothetical protein H6849_02535 [Alphaproteobacteria bacterium]
MVKVLRTLLVFSVVVAQASTTRACADGTGETFPSPLTIARAMRLDPHPSIDSLEPMEVVDPHPYPSGRPRVKRAEYLPVTSTWQTKEEIEFAQQCFKTACSFFLRYQKEGKSGLITAALHYARAALYYGHSEAGSLMMNYYGYKIAYIPLGGGYTENVRCPGKPDFRFYNAVGRTRRGFGGTRTPVVAYGFNARALAAGKTPTTGDLDDKLGLVLRDIFRAEDAPETLGVGVGDVVVVLEESKEEGDEERRALLGTVRHRRTGTVD